MAGGTVAARGRPVVQGREGGEGKVGGRIGRRKVMVLSVHICMRVGGGLPGLVSYT